MKQTKFIMGMPITIEILADSDPSAILKKVFAYFNFIDEVFSPYKKNSDINRINRNEITLAQACPEVRTVFRLAQQTKQQTFGFFDILTPQGAYDPSGLVKGWAIQQAAKLMEEEGYNNFFVEAGGDVQVKRPNTAKQLWKLGIRNPFNSAQHVKILHISDQGVATSGTYERGQHIYNPFRPDQQFSDVVSLTVIGPNIYEADRFATAAFAMGSKAIEFIENMPGLEGYQIHIDGLAVQTSGLQAYLEK